jgi:hypothetical protein
MLIIIDANLLKLAIKFLLLNVLLVNHSPPAGHLLLVSHWPIVVVVDWMPLVLSMLVWHFEHVKIHL